MKRAAKRDPVTQYAVDVVAGKVIAARLVRLACQRHLRDLGEQEAKGLVWRPAAAQEVIDFFAEVLRLPENTDSSDETIEAEDDVPTAEDDGKPFILSPFQAFIAGSLFGWYTAKGRRRYRVAYVETAKGSGKALALDTPLATPDGWTTMGAIQAGDNVFDDRGRICTVLGTSAVMHDHQCYEVVFDDGSTITADAEHLWSTEMRRSNESGHGCATKGVPRDQRGAWRHALRTTEQIRATLRYPNGKYQSANHSIPLTGPLGTTAQTLPIHPYVLGVWLGDGDSDCARITVADADADLLDHVAACGVSIGERKQSSVAPRAPRYRIGGTGGTGAAAPNSLNAQLRRARLFDQRKTIPSAYLRGSVDQRLALLQGLMDTDGYISPETGACEFCSTDESLAVGAHELVVSLGIKASLRESAAKLYGREVSRRWRLQFHPPHDLPVFRLARKLTHQVQRHGRRRLSGERRIVDVRPVPSVPVKCIAVDSPSHLYLAGRSMIPTHNTPFGAGIMLYMLVADGERGAQVYAAANSKDQAKLAFTDAERMVKASPPLRDLIDPHVNNLAVLATGSYFRPISAEKKGLDGKRVHGALLDELHEQPTNIVTTKMRAGTKGRPNALILEITNSGFDLESVCWKHHDYSRQILEGTVANEAWFAFVCHLDPCEACLAAGKTQPSDDCADCDDWKTEGPHWLKANPNLGVSLPWQYLREQVREAIDMPSQRNMVRRLNFCQWTQQQTAWIPSEQWAACKGAISSASLVGRDCYVGIDLSDKVDLSAVVLVFPRAIEKPPEDDEEPGPDEGSGSPAVLTGPALDRAVDVLPFFWMPAKTIHKRAQEDKVPYPDWVTDRWVHATIGTIIDHDAIVDFIISTLAAKYRIRKIGIDQAGAAGAVNRLKRHFGDEMVDEVPQGFRRLSEPSKLLEALIVSGNLSHDGNPCMAWNISNMAIEENNWREIRPVKMNQRKRIDGGVALVDALAEMLTDTAEPSATAEELVFVV